MSSALFAKTQSLLKHYGDSLNARGLVLQVQKPVKHFPPGVDGVLFLPNHPTLIAFSRSKEPRQQWIDWEHRDQVVDVYGFGTDVRAFGLKDMPGGKTVPITFSRRPPTMIERLGPEFEQDLYSVTSHKVLAEKWNVKPQAISYQRRVLGVKIQRERREKGLTTYLQ